MELFRGATGSLRADGWTCEQPLSAEDALPSALRTASEPVIRWVPSFSLLSNSDDTVWFLSRDDFTASTDSAFAWHERSRNDAKQLALGPWIQGQIVRTPSSRGTRVALRVCLTRCVSLLLTIPLVWQRFAVTT